MSLVLDSWMYPSMIPDLFASPHTHVLLRLPLVVVFCSFTAMIAAPFLFSRPKLGRDIPSNQFFVFTLLTLCLYPLRCL